ncbi:hypothetical protein [Micromonospora sp. NPDC048839]|uniref:hypothetical protein n=1 Tax=Micromonospora sp. NPDC048839 TaxID=3155641 RepID=UPI00340A049D
MAKPDENTSTEQTDTDAAVTPPAETPPDETEVPGTEVDEDKDGEEEIPAEVLRKRLTKANAEAANFRTKLREAEAKLTAAKTVEEFEAATQELRTANQALEHELLVERVARKAKLPDDLAGRLKGSTYDELLADAKALARYAVGDEPGELRGGLNPNDDEGAFDPVKTAREARARRY